jgi:hypothetical protein
VASEKFMIVKHRLITAICWLRVVDLDGGDTQSRRLAKGRILSSVLF